MESHQPAPVDFDILIQFLEEYDSVSRPTCTVEAFEQVKRLLAAHISDGSGEDKRRLEDEIKRKDMQINDLTKCIMQMSEESKSMRQRQSSIGEKDSMPSGAISSIMIHKQSLGPQYEI